MTVAVRCRAKSTYASVYGIEEYIEGKEWKRITKLKEREGEKGDLERKKNDEEIKNEEHKIGRGKRNRDELKRK